MGQDINPDALSIPTWVLNADEIAALASGAKAPADAVATLVARAEAMLDEPAESVVEKKPLPPSGDRRDYMSLAIYVWPDPAKADGLPYIHKDGVINPEIHDYDLPRLYRTVSRIETLSLAALYTGQTRYAARAAEIMRVWFLDERTAMRPHLDYGQFVPGECEGRCYGIIETVGLLRVTNAVGILESLAGFDYADGAAMRQWFARYADWLADSELGRAEAATTNNHRAWHTAQLAGFRLFTGEGRRARTVLEAAVTDIIDRQMADDGSMPRELARTRSYHYVSFVLSPLLLCAKMADELELDLTSYRSPTGGSIGLGVDWFVPYLLSEKSWTWQQIREESPFEDTYPIFRMAANVLRDRRYEAMLKTAAGEHYDKLMMDLILPPRW